MVSTTEKSFDSAELELLGSNIINESYIRRKPAWVGGQISQNDAIFLSGLVQFLRPTSVVEIGVASGWSSSILLESLGVSSQSFRLFGLDLSVDYYLDKSIRTGSAVDVVVPNYLKNYHLTTGCLAFEAMPDVGSVDFGFIDAHHMHPWATFDLIALMPFMRKDSWVAMHDINLCRFERHMHKNRGPFYLYYLWPDAKLNSTQKPSMIGAIKLEKAPEEYLSEILEILCTPWEISIEPITIDNLEFYIKNHFGKIWSDRFRSVCEIAAPKDYAAPKKTEEKTAPAKTWWRR